MIIGPNASIVLRFVSEGSGFRVLISGTGFSEVSIYCEPPVDDAIPDVIYGHEAIDYSESQGMIDGVSDLPISSPTGPVEDVDQMVVVDPRTDDVRPETARACEFCAQVSPANYDFDAAVPSLDSIINGCMSIDPHSRIVSVNASEVPLTRIEFDLLFALASAPERVLSRAEITSSIWGQWYGDDANLDVHMSRLRKKIIQAGGPRVGHAVRSVGFRLH